MMWIPTQDDAVEMYARFLLAHRGSAAGVYARRWADRLGNKGDAAGHMIWSRVADTAERNAVKEDVTLAS